MAKEALRHYNWSVWHRFDAEVAKTTVLDEPGVYELRTDFKIGRLRGNAPLVTIGSAVPSLQKRIHEERLSKPARYQDVRATTTITQTQWCCGTGSPNTYRGIL